MSSSKEIIDYIVEKISKSNKSYSKLITLWQNRTVEKDDFSGLLQKLLMLEIISLEFIQAIFVEKKELLNNEANVNYFYEIFSAYHRLLEKRNNDLKKTKIIIFGGAKTGKEVCVFNLHGKKMKSYYPPIPEEVKQHCALQVSDMVYCLHRENWKLDLTVNDQSYQGEWQKVVSMQEPRIKMAATVYQDNLVVVGGESSKPELNPEQQRGKSEKEVLKSGELYQVNSKNWKTIPPMNEKRKDHALVSCNGYLYALGGTNEDRHLCSMERLCEADIILSIEENEENETKWELMAPMPKSRHDFAAVSFKEAVYVIGGRNDDGKALKSVLEYDPDSNIWDEVEEMENERCSHSACVLLDMIYVFGGISTDTQKEVFDIEYYDPVENKWDSLNKTLGQKLHEHASLAIKTYKADPKTN